MSMAPNDVLNDIAVDAASTSPIQNAAPRSSFMRAVLVRALGALVVIVVMLPLALWSGRRSHPVTIDTALLGTPVRAGATALTPLGLSYVHYYAGRFDESVAAARAELRVNPNSADAYNNIAACAIARRRWDDAIANAGEALRLRPNHDMARNNLMLAKREKLAYESAPEAHAARATQLFREGRFRECVEAAGRAVELKPDFAIAYNNMAACWGAQGQWDDEIAAARAALRLQPDFPIAQRNLDWALAQRAQARR